MSLLAVVYIGLGKTNVIIGNDNRQYKGTSERFNASQFHRMSEVEPEYTGIAFTMTVFIGVTYTFIVGLFYYRYRKYVLWPKHIIQFCSDEEESSGSSSLKEPMKATSKEFARVQKQLYDESKYYKRLAQIHF